MCNIFLFNYQCFSCFLFFSSSSSLGKWKALLHWYFSVNYTFPPELEAFRGRRMRNHNRPKTLVTVFVLLISVLTFLAENLYNQIAHIVELDKGSCKHQLYYGMFHYTVWLSSHNYIMPRTPRMAPCLFIMVPWEQWFSARGWWVVRKKAKVDRKKTPFPSTFAFPFDLCICQWS